MHSNGTVTILGINGHIGHAAAKAFAEAGWTVRGFGRSNKQPIAGVEFIKGDAESVADMRAAVAGADVVVNALNLPYDKWWGGAMEAQAARVIEAIGASGQTVLFPGNIYNYSAADRHLTPDTPQRPETPRGAIRVRVEQMFRQAADRGDFQFIVIRAGDFFAPHLSGDWFDQGILREAGKGKMAMPSKPEIGHSWAYLPDLGRAFEKLAWHRKELRPVENFHFSGHFVTGAALRAAIEAASPVRLKVSMFPWGLIGLVGLVQPLMRDLYRMRYLWEHTMELEDSRLDAILGPDFGTPFPEAIEAVVKPFFGVEKAA